MNEYRRHMMKAVYEDIAVTPLLDIQFNSATPVNSVDNTSVVVDSIGYYDSTYNAVFKKASSGSKILGAAHIAKENASTFYNFIENYNGSTQTTYVDIEFYHTQAGSFGNNLYFGFYNLYGNQYIGGYSAFSSYLTLGQKYLQRMYYDYQTAIRHWELYDSDGGLVASYELSASDIINNFKANSCYSASQIIFLICPYSSQKTWNSNIASIKIYYKTI